MTDTVDRALDSLSSDFKPIVIDVLARLVERGVPVMIIQTARTPEQQAAALASGHSSIPLSKHLPRKLRGIVAGTADDEKADAIDLCPYDVWQAVGPDKLAWSDSDNPQHAALFATIGELGEAHGLRWGGRWHAPHDPGHLELEPVPKVSGVIA